MARRYDPEFATTERFKAYLIATLSQPLQLVSPVVAFYDPMAQDDAHRVVVMPGAFDTQTNDPQSWAGEIEITVKSQITEAKMQADLEAHVDRTNEVREALLRSNLVEKLNKGVGLGVDQVSPNQKLSSDFRKGWAYSDVKLMVACHAREAADDVV